MYRNVIFDNLKYLIVTNMQKKIREGEHLHATVKVC